MTKNLESCTEPFEHLKRVDKSNTKLSANDWDAYFSPPARGFLRHDGSSHTQNTGDDPRVGSGEKFL